MKDRVVCQLPIMKISVDSAGIFFRNAFNGCQIGDIRTLNQLNAGEAFQQPLSLLRPDTRYAFQFRLQSSLPMKLSIVADGKTMCLVPDILQKMQG